MPTPPLWLRVYSALYAAIVAGIYGPKLPPLPELVDEYGVSERTLRHALDRLEREGMILRQRGRGHGTMILSQRPAPVEHRLAELEAALAALRGQVEVLAACHQRCCSPHVADEPAAG